MSDNKKIFDSCASNYNNTLKESLGIFNGKKDVFADYKIKYINKAGIR